MVEPQEPGGGCEGLAKVLRKGKTGPVVRDGDESAFAAVVLRLVDNPGERERLDAEARGALRELRDWDATVDDVAGVCRHVVAWGGPEHGRGGAPSAGVLG